MTTAATHRGVRPGDASEVAARLRRSGGRVTRAKMAMAELFFTTDDGLTAEDIVTRLPEVDKATIYRTLVQFEQAGILEHVHLGHGAATYRLAGGGLVPVVCEACGRVVEVPADELAPLIERLRRNYGIVLDVGHFALTGRCTECHEQTSAP